MTPGAMKMAKRFFQGLPESRKQEIYTVVEKEIATNKELSHLFIR
jgi:hypothetical protein